MQLAIRFFVYGVCCASLSLPAAAQRAVAPGSAAHASAPAVRSGYVAPRASSPYSRGSIRLPTNVPPPLGLRAPAAGYTGINPGALRSGSNGRGYRGGIGYFMVPYYPYVDGPDYEENPYPFDATAPDPNAQGAVMMQNMLGQQIQQLSAEIDELRNSGPGTQPQAGVPYAPQAPAAMADAAAPAPPITVVLRDGQELHVNSYAVMGQTFWDFSQQPARKIPLANIDVAASTRATEANGSEFPNLKTPTP